MGNTNNNRRNGITHPILNYLGGKWRIAPWVCQHFPAHRCYVELFGGAASVLLCKPPAPIEVLNDLDGELNTLYEVLRSPARLRALLRRLQRTPYGRQAYLEAFKIAPSRNSVETARRLIVRSSMGFPPSRAIRRETATFAISWRRNPTPTWRNYLRGLPAVTRRLRKVVIEQRPALALIDFYDSPDTLFYADPPYVPETRSSQAKYNHEMSAGDHVALLTRLRAIEGMAVVSGYPSDLYDDLLRGWPRVTKKVQAFSTAGANPRNETLWLSPSVSRRLGVSSS